MFKNLAVATTRSFKGGSELRHSIERPLLINLARNRDRLVRPPNPLERNRLEWVANQIIKQLVVAAE